MANNNFNGYMVAKENFKNQFEKLGLRVDATIKEYATKKQSFKNVTRIKFLKDNKVIFEKSCSTFSSSCFFNYFQSIVENLEKNLQEKSFSSSKFENGHDNLRDNKNATYCKYSYNNTKQDLMHDMESLLNDNLINKQITNNLILLDTIESNLHAIVERYGMTNEFIKKNHIIYDNLILIENKYITKNMIKVVLKQLLKTKQNQINTYIKNHDLKIDCKNVFELCYTHALINNNLKELRA